MMKIRDEILKHELSVSIESLKETLNIIDGSCFIQTNCKSLSDKVSSEVIDTIFELYETLKLLK